MEIVALNFMQVKKLTGIPPIIAVFLPDIIVLWPNQRKVGDTCTHVYVAKLFAQPLRKRLSHLRHFRRNHRLAVPGIRIACEILVVLRFGPVKYWRG